MSWKKTVKHSLKRSPHLWQALIQLQRFGLLAQSWFYPARNFSLAYSLDSGTDGGTISPPVFSRPTSQLVTVSQFFEAEYRHWCKEIRSQLRFNRKTWEFNFILQVLDSKGLLGAGKKGLGFGCGEEPLPAVMVSRGVEVVASDQSFESAKQQGWADTAQHTGSLPKLNSLSIARDDDFSRLCTLREVDMNRIPADLTSGQFDFCWSACAFEHLGSIEKGLQFVENSLEALKPGGLAVHTTEFNLSSNDNTLEDPTCVVFRKRDIESLVKILTSKGHHVFPVNYHPGDQRLDDYVDLPPYQGSPSLKLKLAQYVVTSIGLVIRKGPTG